MPALAGSRTGNLTPDGERSYLYDHENRLVSASGNGASVVLFYDPLGRLMQTSGSTGGRTFFLWDGDALAVEYAPNGSGAVTGLRRYVHGADFGADDPLVAYEGPYVGASVRRNLYADPRGSIVLVTNATGAIIRKLSYDEYGMPGTTNNTGTMDGRRFQYTGQIYLPDLGMYHYKARIYSPVLGRFLQTDPIGYEDQVNLYAYVGNDPVNGVDPTGQKCVSSGNGDDVIYDCFVDTEIVIENGELVEKSVSRDDPDRSHARQE